LLLKHRPAVLGSSRTDAQVATSDNIELRACAVTSEIEQFNNVSLHA
jgi:hypothetical protein